MFEKLFKLAFFWMDIITAAGSDLSSYSLFTYIFLWVIVVWLFLFLHHILHGFNR